MLESLSSAAFDDSLAPGPDHVALVIPPTDGERLMRFQRYRDEAAFAQVVETHSKMVWGVCSQILRHQQDVEDAFQATFLILARKAGAIRATESAAGWIYRVAYRTALLAHSRRCRRKELQLADELPSLDDQLSEIERNELALRLLEELNALPSRYRQPLVLCYMEGRTRSEAAEQMGASLQTVKGLLARGTRLLRSRLIRRGVALSTAMGVVNVAMSAAQVAAAPALVASTASLGASFALKLKLTTSGIKGASLKGVTACVLAEKGIIAMTIAAASKPAVGILGVCLAVGMLAVADAEPAKKFVGSGGENVLFISTDASDDSANEAEDSDDAAEIAAAEDESADAAVELAAVEEEEEVEEEIEVKEVRLDDVNVDVQVDAAPPQAVTFSAPPAAPPVPTAPPAVAAPPVPPVAATEPARVMAFSVAGAPPVAQPADVLFEAPVPLPVPAVQPLPANFELARKFNFAFDTNNPFAAAAQRTVSAPTLAGGGSEAALKLEGEYWDLKAAGLKKKADAIQFKVGTAKQRFQNGQGEMGEGEILDLSAEKDLTLAEVKLCEMNAQRVRDALEERAKAQEGEKGEQLEMKKAMEAAADAQRAAAKEVKRATKEAKEAGEAAQAEAAKATARAWSIRTQAPAIKIERRAAPAKTPAAPKAPQPPQEVRIESLPFRESSDMAIVPKEELKKLLSLVESTKELEERIKELEEETEGKQDRYGR
ncbi:MAG: hypothetical protein C0485_17385 [Pirellula sp.]|nr:hypothetical protein [Pirellula sp.]